MPQVSAGLLMFKIINGVPEYFLVHPGGPYFTRKDEGSWTIPKGEPLPEEDYLEGAIREFTEETGFKPEPPYIPLGNIRQKSGKIVHAWAFQTFQAPLPKLISNVFILEWPPKSGRFREFPEIDKGQMFKKEEALKKIIPEQTPFILKTSSLISV